MCGGNDGQGQRITHRWSTGRKQIYPMAGYPRSRGRRDTDNKSKSQTEEEEEQLDAEQRMGDDEEEGEQTEDDGEEYMDTKDHTGNEGEWPSPLQPANPQ